MNCQDCVRQGMLLAVLALAALMAGCETETVAIAHRAALTPPPPQSTVTLDRALEDRILALDPERITAQDLRDTLSKAPAPQIMLMHGGIVGVYLAMVSTGQFLVGMGYRENRIRQIADTQRREEARANTIKYCSHSAYNPATKVSSHRWVGQVHAPLGEDPYFIPTCLVNNCQLRLDDGSLLKIP